MYVSFCLFLSCVHVCKMTCIIYAYIYTQVYIYVCICICVCIYKSERVLIFFLQPFIRWSFIKPYHVTLQEPHWTGLTHRLGIWNRHVLPWELILKNTHTHKLAGKEREKEKKKTQVKLLLGTNTRVRHWPLNISQLITRWNYLQSEGGGSVLRAQRQ